MNKLVELSDVLALTDEVSAVQQHAWQVEQLREKIEDAESSLETLRPKLAQRESDLRAAYERLAAKLVK